jgi:hypothetical protein
MRFFEISRKVIFIPFPSNEEAAKGTHSPATRAGVVRGKEKTASSALALPWRPLFQHLYRPLDPEARTKPSGLLRPHALYQAGPHWRYHSAHQEALQKEERSPDGGRATFETVGANQKRRNSAAFSDKLILRRRP